MLIKTLDLTNFQAHKKLSLKFSKYLTVIKGTSGVGKSAILRSLFQLIDEAIPWSVCHTWNTDNTSIKVVGVSGGKESVIERVHSSKLNRVSIDGTNYDYVGKDTPDILANKLNIREQNVQKQKNQWFLIDLKPSQLSKELNSVSGLNIIDASIQEISSRVRAAQTEIRLLKSQATLLDKEINSLYYVQEADVDLKVLERLEDLVFSLERTLYVLTEHHKKLTEYMERKKNLLPVGIDEDLAAVEQAYTKSKEAEEVYHKIYLQADLYKEWSNRLKEAQEFFGDREKQFEEVLASYHAFVAAENHYNELNDKYRQTLTLQERKADYEKIVKSMESDLANIKVCPVCGGYINEPPDSDC